MSTEFPYIEVPEEAYKFFGPPLGDTRIHQVAGPEDEAGYWSTAVMDAFGDCVSPGGVCMYAPVSRAAVHKRMKEGKLTAFFFHPTVPKKTFWGKEKKRRESPYILMPVSEAYAWKKELEERALREEIVTAEELDGRKPDWMGMFTEWNSRFQKQKRRAAEKGKK